MASWNKNFNPKLVAERLESNKIVSEKGDVSFKAFEQLESRLMRPAV